MATEGEGFEEAEERREMGKITAADRRAARAIEYDITDRGGLQKALAAYEKGASA